MNSDFRPLLKDNMYLRGPSEGSRHCDASWVADNDPDDSEVKIVRSKRGEYMLVHVPAEDV